MDFDTLTQIAAANPKAALVVAAIPVAQLVAAAVSSVLAFLGKARGKGPALPGVKVWTDRIARFPGPKV